ncbi:NHL domain-containing protein [Paludisphaera soli]|uniref:NHL domain-containing protein n=1 Tax=Paludisphaera soli TaxID=2712865 RepID=UPI0013EB6B7C|nr:SMP-30/gluconolactonase/LRE family protein [Paludisphaera soli]
MFAPAFLPAALTLAAIAIAPADEPDAPPARIETIVGTGEAGFSGDGGPAHRARLDQPFDVAYDRAGNLYLSDTGNHRIRRVDAATNVITTVAGDGGKGFSGDGGPATSARLDEPYGMAVDDEGSIYFADRLNRRVRKVDGRNGIITTVAGDGSEATSGDGGPAAKAGLVEPNDVALDGRGRLFIADVAGHRVRVVDLASGRIATFAGDGRGRRAGDGGRAVDASFFGPRAVEALADGTLLILERNGHSLRAVGPGGIVSTLAGGAKGYKGDGGPARDAAFDGPKEMDAGPDGGLLIVDTENHAIRRIDAASGVVITVAGRGAKGGGGDGGPATAAGLDRPHGVAFAPDGRAFVIGDTNNHRIRRVVPASPR